MSKKEMDQAIQDRINWLDIIKYDVEKESSANRESTLESISILRTGLMISMYRIHQPNYDGEVQYIVNSINNAGIFINSHRGIESPREEVLVNAPLEEKESPREEVLVNASLDKEKEDPDDSVEKDTNKLDTTEEDPGRSYSEVIHFEDNFEDEIDDDVLVSKPMELSPQPAKKDSNMAGESYDEFDSF